jgi:hypothetical protein
MSKFSTVQTSQLCLVLDWFKQVYSQSKKHYGALIISLVDVDRNFSTTGRQTTMKITNQIRAHKKMPQLINIIYFHVHIIQDKTVLAFLRGK